MLRAKKRAPTSFPFVVFTFGFTIEHIKELGGASMDLIYIMLILEVRDVLMKFG
jgi:hypothetical protein